MTVWLINAPEGDGQTLDWPNETEVLQFATDDFANARDATTWTLPKPPFHRPGDPIEPDQALAWPFNNMAPPAARSWWISEKVSQLAEELGAPDVIVFGDDPIDAYFLLQRQLTNSVFLPNVSISVPDWHVPTPRKYRLPQYWDDEMRRAAMAMADFVFPAKAGQWNTPSDTSKASGDALTIQPKTKRHHTLFPFADAALNREATPTTALPDGEPRLTVVIPCYNLGRFLTEAVETALASTNVDFRVWVIDDGSADSFTKQTLDELSLLGDKRLQITRRTNRGLAETRNFAARSCASPYLAFLDADDAVEPTFFARAVTLLERYANVHWVSSWARFFGASYGIWHAWNTTLPYFLAHNLLIPICVVRRETFLAYGLNNPAMRYGLEDYEGWLSMVENGCGGIAIPEPLTRYRIREKSMFQSINRDRQLFLYDLIAREHPKLYAQYGEELFCLQNANGPAWTWDQPTCYVDPYQQLLERAKTAQESIAPEHAEAYDQLTREHAEAHRTIRWHQQNREELLHRIAHLEAEVGWRKSLEGKASEAETIPSA